MHNIIDQFRSMFRREDGSVAIMSGLMMTLMVPTIIAAVDMTNISKTRKDVQSRLDSALIAATKFDDLVEASESGEIQERGERFLLNALNSAGIDATGMKATFEYDEISKVMKGQVEIVAPTVFTGMVLDLDQLVITSEVTPRERIRLEVALSLDVSGSMDFSFNSDTVAPEGSRRIDALRAGVDSLARVFRENPLVRARMSVIPYSASVNIAGTKEAPTNGVDPVWVAERVERSGVGKLRISKTPPGLGKNFDLKNVGTPTSAILPLTSMRKAVNYVKTLTPDGGTAGHIGAEWALYSLLPDWSDVLNNEIGKSADLNSKTQKVLIVMTDGDFTVKQDPDLTIDDAYEIFQNVCETARDAGIKVYAVGLRASPNTEKQLTQCTDEQENYFSVDDPEALSKAFEEIALQLSQVRISE